MTLAPARSKTRALLPTVLAMVVLVSACGDTSSQGDVEELLAQVRSPDPAARYEAVVRLGMLPPSQARRDGLAGAVRDSDKAVRLMAGIVVIGDGPTEHASWLRVHTEARVSRTPNPTQAADHQLNPAEQLVYMDPWFAGTLHPARSSRSRTETRGCARSASGP